MLPQPSTRFLVPVVTLLILGATLILDSYRGFHTEQTRFIRNSANNLSAQIITLQNSIRGLYAAGATAQALDELFISASSQARFDLAFVTDEQGLLVSATNPDLLGRHWSQLDTMSVPSLDVRINAYGMPMIRTTDSHYQTATTWICQENRNAGCNLLFAGLNLEPRLNNAIEGIIERVRYSLLGLVATSLVIFLLLTFLVTKPAIGLRAALGKFGQGDRTARSSIVGAREMGKLGVLVNLFLDEVQRHERNLIEKRNRYETLIQTMADGLITIHADGKIESINKAGESILGYEHAVLPGSNFSILLKNTNRHGIHSFLHGFLKSDSGNAMSGEQEVEMRRMDGSLVPVRMSLSRVEVGNDALFIGVMNDISAIKTMEQELRALNRQLQQSNERLEKTVITDGLTGLFNRRHFDTMFNKELQRSTRQRTSLSLLMIDIDFFKQFNDRYGHAQGDEALKAVSSAIRKLFKRSGDLPSRYGGEEFAIILPGCDGLEMQERAESLRAAIHELKVEHEGSRVDDYLTISVGGVTFKPDAHHVVAPKPRELFSQADKALYQAKSRGRNQVVFAGLYQPMPTHNAGGHLYGHLIS